MRNRVEALFVYIKPRRKCGAELRLLVGKVKSKCEWTFQVRVRAFWFMLTLTLLLYSFRLVCYYEPGRSCFICTDLRSCELDALFYCPQNAAFLSIMNSVISSTKNLIFDAKYPASGPLSLYSGLTSSLSLYSARRSKV